MHLTARNLAAELPLDPTLLPGLPATLHGSAHLDLTLVQLDARRSSTQLQGTHRGARPRGPRRQPRRRSAATRCASRGGDGEPVGQIHDLGGPLAVEGTLRLTRQGGLRGRGPGRRPAGRPARAHQQHALPRLSGCRRPAAVLAVRARSSDASQLPERPQQREIQRGAHRLGPERARERRVGLQLRPVALQLLRRETASSPPPSWRLVLKSITQRVPCGIDERAVDRRCCAAVRRSRRSAPARACASRCAAVENPAAALIGQACAASASG